MGKQRTRSSSRAKLEMSNLLIDFAKQFAEVYDGKQLQTRRASIERSQSRQKVKKNANGLRVGEKFKVQLGQETSARYESGVEAKELSGLESGRPRRRLRDRERAEMKSDEREPFKSDTNRSNDNGIVKRGNSIN